MPLRLVSFIVKFALNVNGLVCLTVTYEHVKTELIRYLRLCLIFGNCMAFKRSSVRSRSGPLS